jgi:hypothetical protein
LIEDCKTPISTSSFNICRPKVEIIYYNQSR